ncbi:hypothetical protein V2J09_000920 [Rumex salicifolius]
MWHHALPPELGMYVVHPSHDPNSLISDPNHSVNVGVIPLLPPGLHNNSVEDPADLAGNRFRQGAIQFWQGQQHAQPPRTLNFDQDVPTVNELDGEGGGAATPTCQDCGNQAKKDCTHRRCRTCCRSRGLHCSTHVKSTWVSAARRRERHMVTDATAATAAGGASSGSTSGVKKPRLVNTSQTTTSHTSTSNTPTRSYDTSSSQQDANLKDSLPGQVKAPAVFKCVRVTAVEDGEDEFAYQAVVKIGGHVAAVVVGWILRKFMVDQEEVSTVVQAMGSIVWSDALACS